MKKREYQYNSSALTDKQKLLFLRQYLKDYQDISSKDYQLLTKFLWCSTLYNDFVKQLGSSSQIFNAQKFAKKQDYQTSYLNDLVIAFNLFIYSPYKFLNGQSDSIDLNQPFAKKVLKERLNYQIINIQYGSITAAQSQGLVDYAIESNLKSSLKILFKLYTVQLSKYWLDSNDLQKLNNFIVLRNIQTQLKQIRKHYYGLINSQQFLVKAMLAPGLFDAVIQVRSKRGKKKIIMEQQQPNRDQKEVKKQEPKKKKTKQQLAKQKEEEAKKNFKALKDDEWFYNSRKLRNQQSQYQRYKTEKLHLLERLATFQTKRQNEDEPKKKVKIRIIPK